MAGSSNGQNDIVWPGYVAAMASLLLSLLLVCAVLVMTIGQIGSISESYQQTISRIGFGAGQDIGRLAEIAGLSDDPVNESASGGISGASGGSEIPDSKQLLTAQFHSAKFGRKAATATTDVGGTSDTPLVLDVGNARFDRDAAKQAAALAAQDKQILSQVDLSKVDIRKIRFNNFDFSGIVLNRNLTAQQMAKIDFSGVDLSHLTSDRVKKIKPFLAKEAILYQIEIQKSRPRSFLSQAINTSPAPTLPVIVPKPPVTPMPATGQYRIVFSDETTELNRAQRQLFLNWVDSLKTSTELVRVSTEIPAGDDFLQRSAFSRLQLVRSWLLDAGLSSDRVRIALLNAGSAPLREMSLSIELQKR